MNLRTVGVEEELLLADVRRGRAKPAARRLLQLAAARGDVNEGDATGSLASEFQEHQLELYTSPQASMAALEVELRSWRDKAATYARQAGSRLFASATCPVEVEPRLVPTPRYHQMAERFGLLAREQLTCGCHVHVSVTSPQEAVGVLDRIRVWLPALLALSANSPFWQGQDTGYASYRSRVLARWPVSGPTDIFGTRETYRAMVDDMLASSVILDEGMIYFDARCSHRYPTVEIRVADVCLDVRDAVLLAALCRALVETAAQEWAAGKPPPPVPTPMLSLATWQAARWGISAALLDPLTSRPRPASEVLAKLACHVASALRSAGDQALVSQGIERIFVRGNGATHQREVFARTSDLTEVISAHALATAGDEG